MVRIWDYRGSSFLVAGVRMLPRPPETLSIVECAHVNVYNIETRFVISVYFTYFMEEGTDLAASSFLFLSLLFV